MFSLRSLPTTRAPVRLLKQSANLQSCSRSLSVITRSRTTKTQTQSQSPSQLRYDHRSPRRLAPLLQSRAFASKTSADSILEAIQDQYATARDEFEIAAEETEKKTIYAADDRAAARKELDALKEMFEQALGGEDAEEVKGRVGPRIRELESAVVALEESALHD